MDSRVVGEVRLNFSPEGNLGRKMFIMNELAGMGVAKILHLKGLRLKSSSVRGYGHNCERLERFAPLQPFIFSNYL